MEAGFYLGKVVSVGTTTIGASPAIRFAVEISERSQDGDWVDCTNGPISVESIMYMTEKTEAWTMSNLNKLGFNRDFLNMQLKQEVYDSTVFEMRKEEYMGIIKEKWYFENMAPGGAAKPLEPSAIDVLNAKYRKQYPEQNTPAPGPASAPATPPQSNASPATPPTEEPIPKDDIPF